MRANQRTPGVLRENRVRPRKLGHVVVGSTDYPTTRRFFTDGKFTVRVPPGWMKSGW